MGQIRRFVRLHIYGIRVPSFPRDLSEMNKTAWAIVISWKQPKPANGPILNYRVLWGSGDSALSSNETKYTSFEVKDLVPYTNYTFQVSAFTEVGWGPETASLTIRTDIAEPSAPMNLSMTSATSSNLVVEWLEPEYPNGPILKYRVRWSKTKDKNLEEKEWTNETSLNYWRISNLDPYTNYSIQISAKTSAGFGPWTDALVVQTATAVPSPARVVTVRVESSGELTVEWDTPSTYPGPTKYSLQVWQKPGHCNSNTVDIMVSDMVGSKGPEEWKIRRAEIVEGLIPYTKYFVRIILKTDAGDSASKDSSSVTTPPDVPGAPSQLQADCSKSSTEAVVKWNPPQRPNGKIVQYLVKYGVESSGWTERAVHVSSECKPYSIKLENLRPEKNYQIYVRAKVENVPQDGTEAALSGYCILPAGVPPMGNSDKIKVKGYGSDQLLFEWTRDVFSDDMGALVNYAVLVGISEAVGNASSGRISDISPSWFNFSSGISDFYQATPLQWNPFDKKEKEDPLHCEELATDNEGKPTSVLRCTIGAIKECYSPDPYCNGPLQPDTVYGLKLRAFTRGGFSETQLFFAKTGPLPKGSSIVGALVGSFIFLALLGASISAGFILKKKGKLEHVREFIQSKLGQEPSPSCPPMEQVLQLETWPPSKPLTIHNFAEHIRVMMSDSHLRFSQEFEALKQNSPKFPCTVAEMDENRSKNRWLNIFPYDHSRVKLLPLGDEPASDFVNANYIPGYSSLREYIASQGPLASTVDDFWRMVWEQSVTMIVMLTQCVERGKNKCEQYWPQPGEAKHYGDMQVRTLSESMLSCYTIRLFHVQLGSRERRVKQMHFTHWPDFGCPESPDDLINFVRAVRDHLPRIRPGPILVHCSAGVGRTGTFIAVDRLSQQMPFTDDIDIYGTVMELRQHRINMVQTEDQYIYIHLCMQQLINEKNQPPESEREEAIYSNICVEKDTGV